MNDIERTVTNHYGDGQLLSRILAGLGAAGVDVERLRLDDLASVEEFHIGGRAATAEAVETMALDRDQHVLDVGCGIGGAARYIASQVGCQVTGIDLTPEYIAVAKTLTDLTGLSDRVAFEVSNALAMPFANGFFDAAVTLHVAMNIRERSTLYGEIARVLRPGAIFFLFDVMKNSDEPLDFPVPWAASDEASYLTTPDEMRVLLSEAGFELLEERDRTGFALEFFRQQAAAAADQTPALGLHLVMGESAGEKLRNVRANIESSRLAPVQMIARRRPDRTSVPA